MRVLVATDFSSNAEDALALVAGLEMPAGSAVRIVHVLAPFPTISALAPASMIALAAEGEREIMTELDRQTAMFRERALAVQTALVIGRPADMIVEEAQRFHADLVVVGSRGRRRLAATLLGSVSAEVVDRAPCPVLIARGRALTRLILAEDGSDVANAGADLVTSIPALHALPVQVVSVVDAPFPFAAANSDAGPTMHAAIQAYYDALPSLREAATRTARDRSAKLSAAGVSATPEVREGDAADELIAAAVASHADGIVIGSHGRTGVSRLFLGSVARAVLFDAPCSVLVVRAPVAARNAAPRVAIPAAR